MTKCPYCKAEVYLVDFFEVIEKVDRKGNIKRKIGAFKGQSMTPHMLGWGDIKMWACPSCDSILGFSEYRGSS